MKSPPAVELAGYLDAAVGVGEAARRYVLALRSAGIPVRERNVPLPGRDAAGSGLPTGPSPPPEAVMFNLLCLNPEQMVPYLDSPESPSRDGRATIGIWSWEVDVVPAGWRAAAAKVDEVWTYSRFAAELIGTAIGTPVQDIPPPVSVAADPVTPSIRWPAGFRVLIMFDYLSTLERKNPIGAINAFRRAFPPGDGATLVVKSVNGQHRLDRQEELKVTAGGRDDILLIDRTMSGAERDALIASCDCYLSLHRSEGHGLPLAEAMASGKSVVATAYGGNNEFMRESNSYPVAWTMTPVGKGVEHYPAAARWAEPDIDHAARLLRRIREDPDDARLRTDRARADVRALLAPEVVGARMYDRLEKLGGVRSKGESGLLGMQHLMRRWRPGKKG
jgi:glycosyltransferase involved in cell wall biosynthesis